jgi:hypothetical protein
MARNRRHQSAAIRFSPVLKVVLLCSVFCGSGVGYVWQKSQIAELGQQIRKRELRLTELDQQNEKMKKQLAIMRSPQFLETRIRELNLGLVRPQESQKLILNEPVPESARPPADRQLALQSRPAAAP